MDLYTAEELEAMNEWQSVEKLLAAMEGVEVVMREGQFVGHRFPEVPEPDVIVGE